MLYRILYSTLLFCSLVSYGKPGDRVIYQISLTEKVRANYQSLGAGKRDTAGIPAFNNFFENQYRFSLSVIVLAEENNYQLMQCNINWQLIALKQDNQADEKRAAVFSQLAEAPFYFKISPAGNIYAIQSPENSPPAYINFLRDLLSQLQMVTPTDGLAAPSWTINQEYPDGMYRVRYDLADSKDVYTRTIVTKLRDGAQTESGSTDSVIEWKNTLSRLAGHDMANRVLLNKKFYQKLGATTLAYVERNLEAQADFSKANDANWKKYFSQYQDQSARRAVTNIYNPVSEERRKTLVSQGVLKKDTYETLMTRLPTAGTMDNENLNMLVSKFRALCYLQPQHIPAILQQLLESKATETSFAVLAAALIEVDNEPAQDALAQLISRHENDWSVLQRLIPAIGLRKYLSAGLEEALMKLRLGTGDAMIVSSAGLALSNLCRSIGEKQAARADSIMNRLVQEFYNGPKDKSAISRFLNETGNAGYEKSIEENKRYLFHEDIDIRLRAWYSLRLFKPASTDSLLSKGLMADTASAVQQRILTLVHMRAVSPVFKESVLQVLKVSGDTQNIDMAIIWLEKYVKSNPGELAHIKQQIRSLNNKVIEEKFNQRLAQHS